jgi:hypothetical protein
MTKRADRVLAWGLCGLAIAGAVAQLGMWLVRSETPPAPSEAGQTLLWAVVLPLVFAVLAAMIIARQPRNVVGWLMMVIALSAGSVGALTAAVLAPLAAPPATLSAVQWLALWVSGWSWIPMIFPIFLIPLFFPTGSPPTPRWRWVAWLTAAMVVVFLVLSAGSMQIEYVDWTIANPIGFVPASFWDGGFMVVWTLGLVTVLVGSVASLYVRYRRAAIAERQQIKWLLFAGILFAVFYSILALFFSDSASGSSPLWIDLLFSLSVLAFPASIAIAIFRYHVWDLEVVVNRAVIYGLLTTLLAGLFAAIIAVITEAGKDLLGEGSRAAGAAISALVVAVVFQPLRTWIETVVNRRFYPDKLDLASGLVEVGPEYWGFLDRSTLVGIAMDHVRRTLGTRDAAFFLAAGAKDFRLEQRAGDSADGPVTIALSDKDRQELQRKRVIAADHLNPLVGHVPIYVDRGKTNDVLGLLSIGGRTNGRGYSGDDLRALAELGGKIGLALNAVQLGSGRRSL